MSSRNSSKNKSIISRSLSGIIISDNNTFFILRHCPQLILDTSNSLMTGKR